MQKITCSIEDGVAYIRMDDGKVNAMDDVFFHELNQAVDLAEQNGSNVMVITGRENYFSAGLNLKYVMNLSKKELLDFNVTFARTMIRIFALSMPTVAICSGHAIAGGAMLAFACDLRFINSGDYRIQMNETAIGLPVPEWMQIVGRPAIPDHLQTEIFLHAKILTPEQAVRLNVFNGIIRSESAVPDIIEGLKTLNQKAHGLTKRIMRQKEAEKALSNLESQLSDLIGQI